ncbi:unnamed protein product [Periconia digitata]|uniref:Uncharacterized protein n=1 Tax=Periconia digitata TaxID=1303443 RepID=A0A9W4U9X9_9PLEO|nr:unnamed protein product [Periconia digitata]
MRFLEPVVRPFRKRSSNATQPAPSSNTQSSSDERPRFLRLRNPFKRSGEVKTVKVTSEHYLGFQLDSGYHSEPSSSHNATSNHQSNSMITDALSAHSNSGILSLDHVISIISTSSGLTPAPPEASNPGASSLHHDTTSIPISNYSGTPSISHKSAEASNTIESRSNHAESEHSETEAACDSLPPIVTSKAELNKIFASIGHHTVNLHCPEAQQAIDSILEMQDRSKRLAESNEPWDPLITWNNHTFPLSSVEGVGQDWVHRVSYARKLSHLQNMRLVHEEDISLMIRMMFPDDDTHIISDIHARLLANNLADEGLLTRPEAEQLASLALTHMDIGNYGFMVPVNTDEEVPSLNLFNKLQLMATQNRLTDLKRLSIAAAYRVTERAGGVYGRLRFLDACGDLKKYINAYDAQKAGYVPTQLHKYARNWTPQEERILQRSKVVMGLYDRYDAGEITDFAFVKWVRGSYFPMMYQTRGYYEMVAPILYDKVDASGVSFDEISKILALLPEFDECHFKGGEELIDLKLMLSQELEQHTEAHKLLVNDHKVAQKSFKKFLKSRAGKEFAAARKAPTTPFDPFADLPIFNLWKLNYSTVPDLSMTTIRSSLGVPSMVSIRSSEDSPA